MRANYGYKDGSGEYFITIDTDKYNGCGDCVPACPYGVLGVGEVSLREMKNLPCVAACKPGAITHSW